MTSWRYLRRLLIPSRTLSRYMIRLYLVRFFGLLVGLTAILQILDLLAQSDDIMTPAGASWASIVSYISLRLPQLINQFTPFAALLATLLSLATLNQHSEVIVMKATGMSAQRILFPIGIASFMIAASHFTFSEIVVVKANAELEWWQKNDYAVDIPPNPGPQGSIWIKEGSHLILIENVSRLGSGVVLDQVSIYDRAETDRLNTLARADFAIEQDGQWTLHNVRRFNTTSHELEIKETEVWPLEIKPSRFSILNVKADNVSAGSLWSTIDKLKKEGLPTDRLMASFLQKFAGPASTMLMPLLGAVAAFGLSRRGRLTLRIITGMGLGFSFFVADNFMLAMGEFGVAPPFLAAWAPFFLFLILGYAVIFATEEGYSHARVQGLLRFTNILKSGEKSGR